MSTVGEHSCKKGNHTHRHTFTGAKENCVCTTVTPLGLTLLTHPVFNPVSPTTHSLYAGVARGDKITAVSACRDGRAFSSPPDRKMTSSHHMSDTGIFLRRCTESRGWVIRSLRSRKLAVSRNALVDRDPNTRNAQLALSDDLVGRRGSFGTSPGAYQAQRSRPLCVAPRRTTVCAAHSRRPAHWRFRRPRSGSRCRRRPSTCPRVGVALPRRPT